MPLYHFQNFPSFLGTVLHSTLSLGPHPTVLAWALLASHAVGPKQDPVPQALTFWVHSAPLHRELGLRPPLGFFSGSLGLLSVPVSRRAHPPPQLCVLPPSWLSALFSFETFFQQSAVLATGASGLAHLEA